MEKTINEQRIIEDFEAKTGSILNSSEIATAIVFFRIGQLYAENKNFMSIIN
jgi:hypothetical protein